MSSRRRLVLITIALSLALLNTALVAAAEPQIPRRPIYVNVRDAGAVLEIGGPVYEAGEAMTYVATTNSGHLFLATSSAENRIYAFDAMNQELITIVEVGQTPKGVKISPNNKVALVANEAGDSLTLIHLDTWMTETIPLDDISEGPETPHNIVFAPTGKYAYVTLQDADKVAIIDMERLAWVDTIDTGAGPHNLDISPNGKTLYVALRYVDLLAVIDLKTKTVIKEIELTRGHHGVDASPNGKWVYVSGIGAKYVNVIDANTLERVATVQVVPDDMDVPGPHGLRTTINGKLLYVAVTGMDYVAVMDTDTLEIIEIIDTGEGSFPFWIGVPANH